MRCRCPHCHNPIEIVDDHPLIDIECLSCGSSFHLISNESEFATLPPSKRTIGNFELLQQVGIGGFGAVWKARDTELDRIVALKIPRTDALSEAQTAQFFKEARAAAQIKHSNIVSVHEVGRTNDQVFIVSDFIDGANLSEWLSATPMSVREAAKLCAIIADALHAAHEVGVIHRDLKPANILMDLDGQPHIADFGLAKRDAGEITMTMDGQILGTPAFMSPEQARGDAHNADRRSDVYSLGVILYQLLTGELPFRGEMRMLIVQILRDEPTPPRRLSSRVPRDLEIICLKCLNKEPQKRYQTAKQLSEDLSHYLSGEAILARPPGPIERSWKWAKKNQFAVMAFCYVYVFAVVITGLSVYVWFQKATAARIQEAAQNTVDDAREAMKERLVELGESHKREFASLRREIAHGTAFEKAYKSLEKELGPNHEVVAFMRDRLLQIKPAALKPKEDEQQTPSN